MAAGPLDPTPAESTEPTEPTEPAAPLNRRERRAAARGGAPTAPKVNGPAGGVLTPPPVRKRNYAARKSG